MLKLSYSVKSVEQRAGQLLEDLLRRIPMLDIAEVKIGRAGKDPGIDLSARVRANKHEYLLVAEVKQSGQPRFARDAINQLKAYISRDQPKAIPIFIAPFLTVATRQVCRNEGVGYLDFEGNVFLSFGTIYIETSTPSRPEAERREIRSLFKPRSAEVLRVLLRSPGRAWKLSELAEESGVSIGHVSNVRNALGNREWIQRQGSGVCLKEPDLLLDAWREAYRIPALEELKLYTPLHGKSWEKALRDFFDSSSSSRVALASFSSAQWMAAYGRTTTQFLYSEPETVAALKASLGMTKPSIGENVIVWVPNDPGVFTDSFVADGKVRCTSPLQTYLDLSQAGERGLEAAEHLRKARLTWLK